MARTISYWYDVIIAEKNSFTNLNTLQPNVDNAQTLLSDVTSTSRVARWRLWVWCVAVCAYAMDVLFDLAKIELEAISIRSRFGTIPWYIYTAKNFQYGDSLVWVNNQWVYSPVITANRIIQMAAATEVGNTVNLKVAKMISGVITPLSSPELIAFQNYMGDSFKVKPAGVVVNVISDVADDLKLYLNIRYDKLVLDATGQLLSSPGTYPVNDSINSFISNMPFNGTLELCDLVDSVQKATGVKSAYVTNAEARYAANPFIAFAERYNTHAGYLSIYSGSPLSSTITYE